MSFDLDRLVRNNIRDLKPYSSARSEFKGSAEVFLDANENSFGSPAGNGLNRYPDPLQVRLKKRIAELKGIRVDQIFVGNGSDEAIDLLYRIFCEPARDASIICPPTYGMYEVSAAINNVGVVMIPLTHDFQLNSRAMIDAFSPNTKLIFICSPNNPTGNLMQRQAVIEIIENFDGIVIIDEAYIDFASTPSFTAQLQKYPNLVVLQTFSKAWGMAGLRVGTAFASPQIVALLNRVKPPYNISTTAQQILLEALDQKTQIDEWIKISKTEREALRIALLELDLVQTIYPSDANFILAKVADAVGIYKSLVAKGIVVRDRSNVELCEGCLRITVGTADENRQLISALRDFGSKLEVSII